MDFTLKDFQDAAKRLKGVIKDTGLIYSDFLSGEYSASVYIKPENLQRTGAFKIRGAYNKIACLTPEQRRCGIVTSSAGNHAQGVALASRLAAEVAGDISSVPPAIIVMPETTPLIKVDATKRLGAEVVLYGDNYDEAYSEAKRIEAERGAVFVHPFDDPEVIIGQGTIALEILDAVPDVDIIVVPVGGGGLIAGIAAAIHAAGSTAQVIGVEPEGAAGMSYSLSRGKLSELSFVNTIADGVAVKRVGSLTFSIVQKYVKDIVTVNDEMAMEALLLLIERQKLIAENAASISVAALRKLPIEGKKVVSLISGGNIDVITIAEMISHGLVSRGRLFSFSVELPHKPGELVKISQILADLRANIIKLDHNQFQSVTRFKTVRLDVTVETNGQSHVSEIIDMLHRKGYAIS